MKKRNLIKYSIGALFLLLIIKQGKAQIQNADVLNAPVDVSEYFYDYQNTFYFADKLADFDPKTGKGKVEYKRYQYQSRQAFNNMLMKPDTVPANEFPATEYEVSPNLPFPANVEKLIPMANIAPIIFFYLSEYFNSSIASRNLISPVYKARPTIAASTPDNAICLRWSRLAMPPAAIIFIFVNAKRFLTPS